MTMSDDPEGYWNDEGALGWVRQREALDRMLASVTEALLEATGVERGERVLDVGCGCGTTTLLFAERVGPTGHVTGLDISGPMLAHARARLGPEHAHVEFRRVDVGAVSLPPGAADLVASQFGVMFFPDPVAAFTNIRRSLSDQGRATFTTWQGTSDNPWATMWFAALPEIERPPPPEPGEPGPFSLADPERIIMILSEAGFRNVRCEELRVPLSLGESPEAAVAAFSVVGPLARLLGSAPEGAREGLVQRVVEYLDARWEERRNHPGAVWLVHARP